MVPIRMLNGPLDLPHSSEAGAGTSLLGNGCYGIQGAIHALSLLVYALYLQQTYCISVIGTLIMQLFRQEEAALAGEEVFSLLASAYRIHSGTQGRQLMQITLHPVRWAHLPGVNANSIVFAGENFSLRDHILRRA